jgi:colanic acid biosynthesis glycosyl transferase WcaI
VAIRLGLLTNPWAIAFFRWMERFVYRKAAAVAVISEGFQRNLLSKGVPDDKIHVIPNLVDPSGGWQWSKGAF